MAVTETNKLVWLVNTIRSAGKISYQRINEKWQKDRISEGQELPRRTFHKWKHDLEDRFKIYIENENCGDYRYYIDEHLSKIGDDSLMRWIFDTQTVSNQLIENQKISDRIILEDIPSGQKYFQPIADAMKDNRLIHITYYNYWREDEREHYLMPLCLKLFRQRWYLVAKEQAKGFIATFCLDRIRDFRFSNDTFEYPKDFSPKKFFEQAFGIIGGEGEAPTIKLRVSYEQSNYLRALPLHNTQKEIERGEHYSIFTLKVFPTYDFEQEILWHAAEMEVLEPQSLRESIAEKVADMYRMYSHES